MRWTLLVDPVGRPGWYNMAMDQALLGLAAGEGRAFLRLYRWEPFCLSFGRHEPALRRYDRAAIDRLGLDTVRRPTGGRAVWHADEVTYAVAAPIDTFGSLAQSYRWIHETIGRALTALGFPASLATSPVRSNSLDAGACFASPAGGEVMLPGGKVVGSAQLREGGAFLQHGSILLRGSQQLVGDLTLGTPPPDGSAALETVRAAPASFDEVARSLADAARAWSPEPWSDQVDLDAIAMAAAQHVERFRGADWTWRR
jgi:lipoate-protein ligase A